MNWIGPALLIAMSAVSVVSTLAAWLVRHDQPTKGSSSLDDAKAAARQVIERLGGQIMNLTSTNDASKQALADASERLTASSSQIDQAATVSQATLAKNSALEGLYYVRLARVAMGMDPGPEFEHPSVKSPTPEPEQKPPPPPPRRKRTPPKPQPRPPTFGKGGVGSRGKRVYPYSMRDIVEEIHGVTCSWDAAPFTEDDWHRLRSGTSVYFALHTGDPGPTGTRDRSRGSTIRRAMSYSVIDDDMINSCGKTPPSWINHGALVETITHVSVWWDSTGNEFVFSFPLTVPTTWHTGNTFTLTEYSVKMNVVWTPTGTA